MTTRALAEYAAGLRYEDLPSAVCEQARLLFLDFVGIALFASAETPWGRLVRQYALRGGAGPATVIGGAGQATAPLAALANGTCGLGFELEDLYYPGQAHPGPPVNAAALAAAEATRTSGRDFLAAVVAGYEVMNRVARAAAPHLIQRGCHPTGHTGVFGAAAAAGRAMGLGSAQMVHALGLAGVQSSGLMQAPNEGAMARRLYGGLPAQSGVQAAELAAMGFTGPERVLEGEAGFLRAYAEEYDAAKLTEGLGTRYFIMDVAVKPYSTCGGFHSALDALLAIRAEHGIGPDDVAEIVGTIPHLSDAHAGYDVPSITGAQYRLPYCLAVALHEGHANAPQFTEAKIRDAAILQTARKVRTEFFERVGADMPGRVTVVLRDGRTLTAETPYPKGSPKKPLTEAERREKFRGLAGLVLAPERVAAIEQAVDRIAELPSLAPVTELLR